MPYKRYRVSEVHARFKATSYLSDVFISEILKARIQIIHHSERGSCGHLRKVIFQPVLLAITTKGCAPVTPVAPLGSTPNLKNHEMVEN